MLEPLHVISTHITPHEFDVLRRVCAADGVSVYAILKRALLAYIVDWVRQHPDMADAVLRPDRPA